LEKDQGSGEETGKLCRDVREGGTNGETRNGTNDKSYLGEATKIEGKNRCFCNAKPLVE